MAKRKYVQHVRRGGITQHEKAAVAALVMDSPAPFTATQERGLMIALRRSPAAVKALIAEARNNFSAKAERYVEIHHAATEAALKDGQLDTALKGSQWAIERIAQDGTRIVDKATDQAGGTKIVVGIQMGGITPTVETS